MAPQLEPVRDADAGELHADVIRRIESAGIRQVRLVTVDLNGVPRAKMVTAERFVGHVLDHGHPWALPLIAVDIWQNLPDGTGYGAEIGFGNGVLRPALETFRQLPWAPNTAHVFGDLFTRDGTPVATPRQVLAGVLERASTAGYEPVFGSDASSTSFDRLTSLAPRTRDLRPWSGCRSGSPIRGLARRTSWLTSFKGIC